MYFDDNKVSEEERKERQAKEDLIRANKEKRAFLTIFLVYPTQYIL